MVVYTQLTSDILLIITQLFTPRSVTMANITAIYKRSSGTKVSVNTMNENHIQAVLTNYVNGNNPRGRKTTWINSDGKRVRISEMPVQYLRNALASIVTPAGNLTSKNRNFPTPTISTPTTPVTITSTKTSSTRTSPTTSVKTPTKLSR